MQSLIGTKKSQSQRFLENGMRIPVTLIDIKNNWVVSHKTADKDKYQAVQLGFSMKKKATKAELGHVKGAKLEKAPKFLREVRLADDEILPEVGVTLNPMEVFAPGDIVNVSGFSKGKGFAGVVKRHGFAGGPKTHGQSDRHRAPGAIGQGTTPGRVYRGKRMAGRMGSDNVTITNLEVVDVNEDILTLKGLVPGVINGLIMIKKVGEDKKFVPLWKEAVEEPAAEVSEQPAEEAAPVSDDTQAASEKPAEEAPAELATDAVTGEPAGEEPTTQDATPAEAENVENTETAEQVEEAVSAEGEENAK
jgi:large subunit ribosomal protein L3